MRLCHGSRKLSPQQLSVCPLADSSPGNSSVGGDLGDIAVLLYPSWSFTSDHWELLQMNEDGLRGRLKQPLPFFYVGVTTGLSGHLLEIQT